MSEAATLKSFQAELNRLVETFGRNLAAYKSSAYDEASLRQEFLNPFFRALGWDIENRAGLIPQHREVETESRTQIGGRQKRADYLFRTHPTDRFVCEAKKPAEELHSGYAFQAKRYAWNKGLALAVLSDFEEMKIYIVGGKPYKDEPDVGLWKSWHFRQYPLLAQELWNLLARERVAAGSIDELIDSLPKRPTGKGKAKQGWLIKPDRSRALDTDFLNFLDEARRELAGDLLKHNDRADLLEGTQLNEAVQRILDRILFLRICEDRDIDTGYPLDRMVRSWRDNADPDAPRRARQAPLELHDTPPTHYGGSGLRAPKGTLWHALVRHFRALDRRPPSHIPFFNGNLFKPHFIEELIVGDEWLSHFLDELGDEESPYLFNYIPVEILGTIYERFLGKIVRPQGRGVTIVEKPEVRKAGGVYYTPRYIVEYIVSQTVGKLLAERKPEDALKLRLLDPACGSGSFLIRAFEVVCEHCQQWLTDHPEQRKKDWCWLEENAVHLTTKAKRRILRDTIYGVDLDPQAVEVTQLSLYLKMLENEDRTTLQRQRELLPGDDDALLPPLENNIKCGNSLIAQDFTEGMLLGDEMAEALERVHAFDWPVQFATIMKAGGFDAVVGNPPYIFTRNQGIPDEEKEYFYRSYKHQSIQLNTFGVFLERSHQIVRPNGLVGFITPNNWLTIDTFSPLRRFILTQTGDVVIVNILERVFEAADVDTCVVTLAKKAPTALTIGEMQKQVVTNVRTIPPASVAPPSYIVQIALLRDEGSLALMNKIESASKPLSEFATVSTGLKVYQTGKGKPKQTDQQRRDRIFHAERRVNSTYGRYLDGVDVSRYHLGWSEEWLSYGDWIAEPRRSVPFSGPRLLVRQIPGSPPYLVHSVFTDQDYYNDINSMVVFSSMQDISLKFLLGVLNSLAISFWFQKKFDKLQRKIFPQFKVKELASFPFPAIDLSKPADRARHDRLVGLVDKLLALTPKLRAAQTDAERQALQNAVTATDQQIDALVYDLYGLTAEEIQLVEGTP